MATLTLKSTSKNGKTALYTGSRAVIPIRIANFKPEALVDGKPPQTLSDFSAFADAKPVLTAEEKKAARKAKPKLTLQQKIEKRRAALARLEAQAAAAAQPSA
jgi:hypothetical protein